MSVGKVVLCSCVNLGYLKESFLCGLCGPIDEIGRIVAAKSYLQFMSFFDLRVCRGQDRRGQTGAGVKVRNLPKTQLKMKKTGVITVNITPV